MPLTTTPPPIPPTSPRKSAPPPPPPSHPARRIRPPALLESPTIAPKEDSFEITVDDNSEVVPELANKHLVDEVMNALEAELRAVQGDRYRQAKLLYEMGSLEEEVRENHRQARARYRAALESDPSHLPSLHALRRVELRFGNTTEAVRLLQQEIALIGTDHERAAGLVELGRIFESRGETEQAADSYRRALELEPGNRDSMEALIALYELEQNWVSLSEMLLRAAGTTKDPVRRAYLTSRAGHVRDALLGQEGPAEALMSTAYRQCPRELEGAPRYLTDAQPSEPSDLGITVDSDLTLEEELSAITKQRRAFATGAHPKIEPVRSPLGVLGEVAGELARLYRRRGRWAELAQLEQNEARYADDEKIKSMRLYRAGRIFAERVGDPASAEDCFEKAAELDSDDLMSSWALAEIRQRRGDATALEATLRKMLPKVRSREQAVATLFEVARIRLEQLDRSEDAVAALRQALELNPHHVPSLRALEDILVEQGRYEELVEVAQTEVNRLRDAPARADAYYELGQLVERHLQNPERAAFFYRTVLDLAPGHCAALDALDRLLTLQQAWGDLVTLLERSAEATPDRRRAAARLSRAAQIAEHRLDNPQRAIDLTLALLETRPQDLDAITALGRLLERTGRWEERIVWLRREVELSEHEPERLALLMSIGAICEVRLDTPNYARDTYRDVVARDPHHRGGLRSLEQLDRRTGRHGELLGTLQLELAAAQGQDEIATINYRMGRLLEYRLGRAEDALGAYRAALAAIPSYRPALDALERLLRAMGLWKDLAALLEELAGQGDDVMARARDWCRVGELREERLNDEEGARRAYLESLKLSADFEPARVAVLRIQEGQGQWAAVAEELAATATRVQRSQRLVSLVRLAALRALRLNEHRGAVTALSEAAEMAPWDIAVNESLVHECRSQRLWERLGPAYASLAENLSDPKDAAAVLHRAALDARAHPAIGDANDYLRGVLELVHEDRAAMDALEAQALMTTDLQSLLDATEKLLTIEVNADQKVSLYSRKGMLLASVGDEPGAYEAYRKALDLDESRLSVLKNLIRIVASQGKFDELAALHEQEARVRRDPIGRTKALMEAGQVYLVKLSQREKAAACFARVMEIEPAHGRAFQLLSGILEETERWPELAEAIRSRLATVTDDTEEANLRLRLAVIERDRLKLPEAALRTLEGLLQIDPEHRKALEYQGGLFASIERWREAGEAYDKAVAAAVARSESQSAQRCRLMLAELQLHRLGEVEAAVTTLLAALAQDPVDVQALRLLIEAQSRRGDLKSAAAALDQLASSIPPGERTPVLMELASMRRDQAGDLVGASDALQRAIVDSPRDPTPIHKLKELHGSQQDWAGLARALAWAVDQLGGDPKVTAMARVELGKTLIERLDKVSVGVEHLETVLRAEPAHPGARFAMARRYMLPPGQPDLAEQQYRAVLVEDPWNVDALRGLFRILVTGAAPQRAHYVGMLLAYLGDQDAGKIASQPRLPARRALGADGYHAWVADAAEPQVFCNLMRAVQSSLDKVYPPDLERHGVSREDRSTGVDRLAPAVDEIAKRFGLEAWETYVSQRNRHACAVEPGEPPKVVVGIGMQNFSAATRRFEIGRVLGAVVAGSLLFTKVPRRELPALLSAIIGNTVRGYAKMGDPNEAAELTRRVGRALPRKVRKLIEEDSKTAANARVPDLDQWMAAAVRSTDRCGLLACADIAAALDTVRNREEHRSPLPHESVEHRIASLRGYGPAEALARFWISPRCEEALSQLGTF
jgi:tetratricopeptide (TPR) repeat protein